MTKSPLRIVFAGTPDFAAASLQALIDQQVQNQYQLVGVYTQPDRPAGRGQKLVQSPVKQLALANDIPVLQPLNFKQDEDKRMLAELDADIMIVAAYGIILPKVVLDTPKMGCINVHASLLPRWRGAAPIHRALMAGDTQTGITIMQMDVGLDTGDMLLKASCEIHSDDTSGSLHDRLAVLGGETLVTALEKLRAGEIKAEPQDSNFSNYADKLTKQEGELNWHQSAEQLDRQVRGLTPWPSAFTHCSAGVMKIHAAKVVDLKTDKAPGKILSVSKEGILVVTGQGALQITELQFPGGKRMKAQDALNGKHKDLLQAGQSFFTNDQKEA
ncbi:methionyl-tRNA formyltransferase [Marinomonas sp. THO17]|uniref:methionyl-tRNA formyltransferase n=1 Tax=Marinomonas sp. THO17 TaxID=3149048 RepID=UPI00336C1C1D